MFAAVPLFVSGASERIAAFAIKCLAVGGAFLAGYVLGGVVAFAVNKWVFAEKTPDVVKKAVRFLAGLALAILVAMIVFGDGGGGGLFGGGADGSGKGTPDADNNSKDKGDKTPPSQPPTKDPPKVNVPNKTPEVKPTDVIIRVTFLGGPDVVGDRFYLLDDEPTAKTFDELKAAIQKKKEGETRKVYLAVQFPAKNRIAEDSINVTQVTDWVRNVVGIEVLWPGKK